MDLYLVPEDPENTTLMSANGTAHFRVTTINALEGSVTYIQRPSDTLEAGLLAKMLSQRGKKTTILNSALLGNMATDQNEQGVEASRFLYRKGRFDASYVLPCSVVMSLCSARIPIANFTLTFGSRSRYFVGNDGAEYRWKYQKSLGWTVSWALV
jgi:hypothetical protein